MSDEVLISEADGVLEIVINRPEQRNAVNGAVSQGITDAFELLDSKVDLRCAILAGKGSVFSAGMDLKAWLKGEKVMTGSGVFAGFVGKQPTKPVIAAVDGPAFAGGMELALACDMIVANRGTKFGLPEVKRGLAAGGGGLYKLPRLLPEQLAMELALTGDPLSAERAYELGMVNRLTDGPAIEGARELAAAIAANGPLAIIASKAVVRDSWNWEASEFLSRQQEYMRPVFASEDAKEGATAFAEKRKPEWKGK